jgi:hypothetical protein
MILLMFHQKTSLLVVAFSIVSCSVNPMSSTLLLLTMLLDFEMLLVDRLGVEDTVRGFLIEGPKLVPGGNSLVGFFAIGLDSLT